MVSNTTVADPILLSLITSCSLPTRLNLPIPARKHGLILEMWRRVYQASSLEPFF